MSNLSNSKRIAKNTFVLYVRSFIVMIISLYTSRVILHSLGITDYGLYNIVGGVVALFSFMRTTMTKSTQRFLNFELAKEGGRVGDTFCTSMNIHIGIAILTMILAESIGLWFLNTHINIPIGREFATNIIYQTTIVSLVITIISVPYNANIIAHEHMSFFAIVSILDALLKLLIAIFVSYDNGDRLITYGLLMMCISFVNIAMYFIYCRKNYEESKFRLMYDKSLTKEMLGYTSWTVVGQVAVVGTNQGNNVLMNMFHGVVANASFGVAHQVNAAIVTLTSNFQTAFNPQITKSFAQKDYEYLKHLVYTTCKISYSLLIIVSLPIMFNMDLILNLWLKEVPPYAAEFCVLIICNSILNAVGAPFNFTALSSNNIKWFQIFTSMAFFTDLIVLYPLFLMGFPAVTALYVKVGSMMIVLFVRVYFAHREVQTINLISFFKEIAIPLIFATLVPVVLGVVLFSHTNNVIQSISSIIILLLVTPVSLLYICLRSNERRMIIDYIHKMKNKRHA